jgi:hypothetical protein
MSVPNPNATLVPPKHYFVDETGDPVLFDSKGRILIGSEGCSRYFTVGLLDVPDPTVLATDLEKLRAELLADPYFKDVPSMRVAAHKTALYFHAKDDLPEVRREVFKLLQRHPVRFSAVVRDKQTVFPGTALATGQPDRGRRRHAREGVRGLLHKTKAAAGSGLKKWLRDIGPTRLSASLTRHGADICPSNREQNSNNW